MISLYSSLASACSRTTVPDTFLLMFTNALCGIVIHRIVMTPKMLRTPQPRMFPVKCHTYELFACLGWPRNYCRSYQRRTGGRQSKHRWCWATIISQHSYPSVMAWYTDIAPYSQRVHIPKETMAASPWQVGVGSIEAQWVENPHEISFFKAMRNELESLWLRNDSKSFIGIFRQLVRSQTLK